MLKKRNPRLVSALAADKPPSTEPPCGSLFKKLVDNPESLAISNKCYNTDFIQGILGGTLDPNTYGGFNVSDAYYCYAGADDYEEAAKRAQDNPELMIYLKEKADSYKRYNESIKDTWRLTGPEAIIPTQATKAYSDWETNIAKNEDPIYTLVAMLPCSYLWAWLAEKLNDDQVSDNDNIYAFWIKENLGFDGSYRVGNFLDTYNQAHPGAIDEAKAMLIYTEGLKHELANFSDP